MAQLSEGAIKKIYDTGDTTATPTLQVWDVKRIGTRRHNPTRRSAILSRSLAALPAPGRLIAAPVLRARRPAERHRRQRALPVPRHAQPKPQPPRRSPACTCRPER